MVSSSKYETDEFVYEVEIEGTCVSIQFSSYCLAKLSQRADVNLTFSVRWRKRYWPIHSRSRKQRWILKNLLMTWITCKRQVVHTLNRTHCSHFEWLWSVFTKYELWISNWFKYWVPMNIDLCRGDMSRNKRTLVVLNFLHLTNDKQKVDKGCRVVNQRWGQLL